MLLDGWVEKDAASRVDEKGVCIPKLSLASHK